MFFTECKQGAVTLTTTPTAKILENLDPYVKFMPHIQLISNQLFPPSQQLIYKSLVKNSPLLQKIVYQKYWLLQSLKYDELKN